MSEAALVTSYPVAAIVVGAAAALVAASCVAGLIARAGFPLSAERGRIGCIDGLRGYLALSVLVHHFVVWMQVERFGGGWSAPTLNLFNQLGAGGVALFFMTSGLVFYPRVRAGFRACSWPAAYLGRFFRIVPLVAVSVALITALIALRTGRSLDAGYPAAALQWVATWAEPPLLGYPDSGRLNAYVLWSLWYEWLFYLLVLPACALATDLIRSRLPSWVVPAALLAGSLGLQALRHRPGPLLLVLPLFAVGMLAYECQAREQVARSLRTPAAALMAVAALTLGMTAFPMPYGLALPLFGVFFACVACGNTMGGLLRTRAARVLGECSYGIYLLHGIVLSILFTDAAALTRRVGTDALPVLLPVAAVVIVLATPITHLLIERPAIRLGHRLAARWTGNRSGAGASGFAAAG